ncbi:PBSX family phage portal protein [Sphingomonas zeicaulis]|uniref:phage portal protein n=1 Tax=Sphingomonas zeicaulis TaxID=1632740 RepID=UPI003D2198B2
MSVRLMSAAPEAPSSAIQAFAFGDAEPVINRREMLYHIECHHNGRWYEPPIAPVNLARAYRVSPHHSSAIIYKRNQLLRHFRPSRWLDRRNFGEWVLNFLTMGNGYLERRDNLAQRPLNLVNAPALYVRRGIEAGRYWWVPGYKQEQEFKPDRVFHLWEPDLAQEIYGLPEYLACLQSAFLNENATLFRRRYYLNGSHAGFVFYLNEPTMNNEDADAIRQALKDSKGPGNFRNLFIHAPNGKAEGVKIIPIAEVAAKDEFLGIKNVTRDDILAAHRVPPQLLGVVPQNSGGFGDVGKAADVFFVSEIAPLMARCLELNDWLGVEAVAFDPYQPIASPSPARG